MSPITLLKLGLLATAVLAAGAGCAATDPPSSAASTPNAIPAATVVPAAPVVNGRPVIARIVSRNAVITVTAGPEGPRYSAATAPGEPIAEALTLEELRVMHPPLYRFVSPAAVVDVSMIDASVPLD